jgi:phospholipid/cholesterol/gamma-HCH transport system substrate-binding protein
VSGTHDASARGRRSRRRYRRMAVIGLLILVVGTVIVFTKQNPFASRFTIRAVFSSAAQLHNGGEVRIAGIQVGDVSAIAGGPHGTALVTMQIGSNGLPIHADATFTIKPRLILEGNAYVQLDPGSPATAALRSGALVPEAQTATSVQLDQVLDTFDQPVRGALQGSVAALSGGLGGGSGQAPSGGLGGGSGQAPSGWRGLRNAVRQFDSALGPVTAVAAAAQGTRPGDLARSIDSTADLTSQLAQSPAALADLVSSYNTTFAALAAENSALADSISGFDAVLKAAPTPLRLIDAALPTLTTFASELRPALHAAPSALTQANGLLDQISAIVAPTELPTLLSHLTPTLSLAPGLVSRVQTLFGYTNPVTSCIATHIVPTLNMKIDDGVNTTGDPIYLDLVHAETGLTGFSSAVDGNGGTVRVGITTGDRIVDTLFPGLGQIVGRLPNADQVRPNWLGYGVLPPYRPDQPCAAQPLPHLDVPAAAAPDWASGARVAHFTLPKARR